MSESERGFRVIKIGREKYTVGEALFQPSILGLEAHGIVEQLVRSISTVSSENHRQLLENTVLCGGTACMTGFEDRFQKEASLCSSAIRPSLVKAPEYMPENLTNYSAWVGGAILAKVVFPQNQHITKGDYDETGPSVISSIDFCLATLTDSPLWPSSVGKLMRKEADTQYLIRCTGLHHLKTLRVLLHAD
ncbi:hypothetical protein RJ639_044446 [Escallonia herrerae]|uniref:Actin-related protein n=1 Tax=Escallonia herrerae TaxID=1293975 RepID=A0AA88WGT9_9ASTE|nr:hypothetical protein RJ639_044446 [Escallonia herrerae]